MDSETLTIAGGTNITTAGSGNTLTINNDFTAAGIGAIVRLANSFNAPNGSIATGTVSTTGV